MQKTNKTLISADIGHNWEGNKDVLHNMIRQAKLCGCDIVKFQAGVDLNVGKQHRNYELYKKCHLTVEEWIAIIHRCHKERLKVSFSIWHISYWELFHLEDYHKFAAKQITLFKKDYDWRNTLVSIPHDYDYSNLNIKFSTPLFCISEYPATATYWNKFVAMLAKYGRIGYSDHHVGISNSLIAVILGACVIEKHFTLDHDYSEFRDHKHAATPSEMKELVTKIADYDNMHSSLNRFQDLRRLNEVITNGG